MELHHRLRRDPNWHPSSCNICGQMGHQAAQCTVGTVNWRAMYGEDAFVMRRAVFQSDIESAKTAKQIDFTELERNAREFAKAKREGTLPGPANGIPPAAATATQAQGAAAAATPPLPLSDLLPGWAAAQDAQGKTYYWHRETKAVQWNKPTAVVAAPAAAAVEGGVGSEQPSAAAADVAAPMG